jgi:hypothetical protein
MGSIRATASTCHTCDYSSTGHFTSFRPTFFLSPPRISVPEFQLSNPQPADNSTSYGSVRMISIALLNTYSRSMLKFRVFAKRISRRPAVPSLNPVPVSQPHSPNSHGIISFADPHPLTSIESYRSKDFGWVGTLFPTISIHDRFNFFRCNIYGPPRKCCKQRTYFLTNSFRCNTYKKQRGAPVSRSRQSPGQSLPS